MKCRSDYLPEVDRTSMAQNKDIYWQPDSGGLCGMGVPQLNKQLLFEVKRNNKEVDAEDEQVRDQGRKTRGANLNLARMDGIFIPGRETGTQALNLNRLEQSLVCDEKFYFFNDEAELIHDREFFEEKIQRLFLIDYELNRSLLTHQRPATRCSRLNQNKSLPFRLDIFIGVLQFTYHPNFNHEDQYMAELRYLIKKYKQRADLALIPHFKKTMLILHKELNELQSRPDDPKKEINLIQEELKRLDEQFLTEKQTLQKIMEQVYVKWELIKEERKAHDSISSPYKLGVRYYRSNENTDEMEFVLQSVEVNKETTQKGAGISPQEENRRNTIRGFTVQLEVLINNHPVATSRAVRLDWPTYQARFMEKLEVYAFTKPATIKLRIKKVQMVSKQIDEIEVEIPGEKSNAITSSGFVLKQAYFAQGRDQIRKNRYKDLVDQPLSMQADPEKEEYEGYISYRTEWPEFGPKMPPESLDMQYQHLETKYEDEIEDEDEKLLQDDIYFDINDPRNEFLVQKMQRRNPQDSGVQEECVVPYALVESKRQKLLKLRFIQPLLGSLPIHLLEQQIEMDSELMQFIINDDTNQNYDMELKLQHQDGRLQILEDFITEQATQKRLLEIQNVLQQRRIEAKLKQSNNQGGLLTLENVVNEFHFEAAASLLAECIKSIFTKRRKLGPQKRSLMDKKSVSQISEVQISILIIQASNVPIRSGTVEQLHQIKQKLTSLQNVKDIVDQLYQLKKVSPAVQFTLDINSKNVYIIKNEEKQVKIDKGQNKNPLQVFGMQEEEEYRLEYIRIAKDKKQIQSTSEVEGVNPEWNELIDFKIGRERDNISFDPSDVINSRNKIVVTLFDQRGAIRQKANNVNQYELTIKRNYIGQITIPLLTLFQQEKISGTFRIQRPLILLNYRTLNVDQFLNDTKSNEQSKIEQLNLHSSMNIVDPHIPTTIDMTMTLDPSIKISEEFTSTTYFPGAESTNLFLYGIRQLNHYKHNFANRNIKFWAENIKGESVYLPRFLFPLQPPQMDFGTNAIEKAARYVALIPFKNDTETFRDLPDIYCTSQEFVDLRAGDFEEHAILLCCFFMYIDEKIHKRTDVKNYVVMGKGLPEGSTQYVMRRMIKSNIVELWNPQTGEPFIFQNQETVKTLLCFTVSRGFQNMNEIEDDACPLRSIACIFDDLNVYVNIQNSDNPSEMSFDVDNVKLWEPFLNQDQVKSFYPKGQTSVQFELQFDPPGPERAEAVQKQLERFLEQKIEDHRRNNFEQQKGQFTTQFSKQKYAELTTYIRDVLLINLESFKYRIRTTGLAKHFRKAEEGNQPDEEAGGEEGSSWDYSQSLQYLQKQQQELMKKKDKLIRTKEIYGFPLNFSYLDDEKAWDEIKATGIADILSDELEYLCIVKCLPYPHYIISCWVFVAVLYRQESL